MCRQKLFEILRQENLKRTPIARVARAQQYKKPVVKQKSDLTSVPFFAADEFQFHTARPDPVAQLYGAK